jgi:serine/threonine-protein kinase SRPK3
MTGTGQQIKAAAIAKAKSAVNSATNGNGSASSKKRKGNQLKPIITTDNQQDVESASSNVTSNSG